MISSEEFSIMVDELIVNKPISYDMLCYIAEKALRSWVKKWCYDDPDLRKNEYENENDIMAEIQLRLIKTTVSCFLLRESTSGDINYDPVGFGGWIYTVAHNLTRDYAARVRKELYRFREYDENLPDNNDPEITEENIEALKKAFSIAISSKKRIYIVLTWLAEFVFILDCKVNKINANAIILTLFEKKTLYEMEKMIVDASKQIPWLSMNAEQQKLLLQALQEPFRNGLTYGQTEYKEFLMKKGGKAAISDWMNRMNHYIKRVMKSETSEY